jgi:hypothetical protein
MTDHLRVLEPGPGILAFYDGRVEGYRFDAKPNWVDDGALGLGVASYAIVAGEEALVYDTGTSLAHGRVIREELGRRGVTRFTVVLSHWHLDHVAGTEAFVDSPVISNERTAEHLREKRAAILTPALVEGTPRRIGRSPPRSDSHHRPRAPGTSGRATAAARRRRRPSSSSTSSTSSPSPRSPIWSSTRTSRARRSRRRRSCCWWSGGPGST